MANANARISVGIDTGNSLAQLRALQSQLSAFNNAVLKSSDQAVAAQLGFNTALAQSVVGSKNFTTSMVNTATEVDRFTTRLEKNKLSMGEYFKYGASQVGLFRRAFSNEFDTINRVAEERVKRLQTQYVSLGKDANGVAKSMAIIPRSLDLESPNTQLALAGQRMQIFNKLVQDGSTRLLNFGKNTQWAGRQLMVGFTIPLGIFGGLAAKTFMDLEKQTIRFRRVYGDMITSTGETDAALAAIQELAKEYTKYGVAIEQTIGLASDAAAAGMQGETLMAGTQETLRLATLGQIEYAQALDATIAMQNAFKISNEELAGEVDFLNAVENQTVVSLNDITKAIPRVAPVVRGLGGDIRDLSAFMAAMEEGGVTAEQGANALKSGLASLINPTDRATEKLSGLGINLKAIIDANRGDLLGTVQAFGKALDSLSKFERQQVLETVFGKYQYARLGALFDNINKKGSQAARVLDLAGESAENLGKLAEKELGILEESTSVKFQAAMEKLKAAIAPVGEQFLKIVTPLADVATQVLEWFNKLPDGIKNAVAIITVAIAGIAPVALMTFGLFANGIANGVKALNNLRLGMAKIRGLIRGTGTDTSYLAMTELDAAAASASLEGRVETLTSSLLIQQDAVAGLIGMYQRLAAQANATAAAMPQGFAAFGGLKGVKKMATGGFVAGRGNKDTEPALLTPGEFVVNKKAAERFGPVLEAMNSGSISMLAQGTRGRSKQVGLKGSYESAHFSGMTTMTRDEIISWAENQSQAVRRKVMQMLNQVGQEIQDGFQVYNNQVVALSREVNSALGKTGSGQRAAVDAVKADLIQRADFAHMELRDQLARTGMSVEEIDGAIGRVTTEISAGFDKLGTQATMTAEEVDNIVQTAYEKVAQTDQRIAAANAEMKKTTAVLDPTARSGKGERIEGAGSYKGKKKTYAAQMGATAVRTGADMPYASAGAMKISSQVAAKIGADLDQIAMAFDQLDKDAQQRLYAIRGNADELARMLVAEVEASSSDMAKAALQGVQTTQRSASPSQAAMNLGEDFVEGYAMGIRSGADDAARSAQTVRAAAEKGVAVPGGFQPTLFAAPPVDPVTGTMMMPGMEDDEDFKTAKAAATEKVNMVAVNAGDLADDMTPASQATRKLTEETEGLANDTKQPRSGMKNFGGKMFGVAMAADALAMGMVMSGAELNDGMQKAIMGLNAVSALSFILPMFSNPITAAIAAVIAALAAAGVGIWYMNKQYGDITKNAMELADSMSVSSKTIKDAAEFFGNKLLVKDKEFEQIMRNAGVNNKQIQQGLEFLETEVGKKISSGFTAGVDEFGRTPAIGNLSKTLGTMVMQGAMTTEQANAVAAAMEKKLNVRGLAVAVQGRLDSLIGPEGKDILKNPITVAMRLQAEGTEVTKGAEKAAQSAIDTMLAKYPGETAFGGAFEDTQFFSGAARMITSFTDVEFEGMIKQLQSYGAIVGTEMTAAYDNLEAAQARYQERLDKIKEIEDPEKKRKQLNALKEEKKLVDNLKNSILESNKERQEFFSNLAPGLQDEALTGLEESLRNQFADTDYAGIVDGIIGQLAEVSDKTAKFNIEVGLKSGELNPMVVSSLLSDLGGDIGAKTLDIMIETQGMDATNKFLLDALAIGDETVRKSIILQYTAETGADGAAVGAEFLMSDEEYQTAKDRLKELEYLVLEAEDTFNIAGGEAGPEGTGSPRTWQAAKDELDALKAEAAAVRSELAAADAERNKLYAQSNRDSTRAVAAQRRRLRSAQKALDDFVNSVPDKFKDKEGNIIESALAVKPRQLRELKRLQSEVENTEQAIKKLGDPATAASIAELGATMESLAGAGLEMPSIDLANIDLSEQQVKGLTQAYNQLLALPPETQLQVDTNALAEAAKLGYFEIKWKEIDSFGDIAKQLGVEDRFTEAFEAFGITYDQYAALPNIAKSALLLKADAYVQADVRLNVLENMASSAGPRVIGRVRAHMARAQREMDLLVQQAQDFAGSDFSSTGGTGGSTGSTGTGTGTGSGSGGSGGGEEKNPLKELYDALKTDQQAAADIQKLKGKLPLDVLARLVGEGADALRQAVKKADKEGKDYLKKIAQLINATGERGIQERLVGTGMDLRASQQKFRLQSLFGLDPEVAQDISNEEAMYLADLLAQGGKAAKKARAIINQLNKFNAQAEDITLRQGASDFVRETRKEMQLRAARPGLRAAGLSREAAANIDTNQFAMLTQLQQDLAAAKKMKPGKARNQAIAQAERALQAFIGALNSAAQEVKKTFQDAKDAVSDAVTERQELTSMLAAGVSPEIIQAYQALGFSIGEIYDMFLDAGSNVALFSGEAKKAAEASEYLKYALMTASERMDAAFDVQRQIADLAVQQIEDNARINFLVGADNKTPITLKDAKGNVLNTPEAAQREIDRIEFEEINPIERQIEGYEAMIEPLERLNELDERKIEAQEKIIDQINEQYDAQLEALDKIEEKEQSIYDLRQAQLNVAGALSRGDVAAAAQAMLDNQRQNAEQQRADQRANLEASRTAQIKAVEEEIEKINADIEKRKKTILGYEDSIYTLEQSILTIQRSRIQPIQDVIDLYGFRTGAGDTILGALELQQANERAINGYYATRTAELNTQLALIRSINAEARAGVGAAPAPESPAPTPSPGTGARPRPSSIIAQSATEWANKGQGGSFLYYVGTKNKISGKVEFAQGGPNTWKQYSNGKPTGVTGQWAFGGMIPGNGMTDSVMGMLMPGEFVVNREATKQFLPMLQAINSAVYPDQSGIANVMPKSNGYAENESNVYNYNIAVNAGTNVSADDIANTVMTKIKMVEARKMRGYNY